jgi:hypothetical protein
MTSIDMLYWLIVGHIFADFVFQPESMAKGKNINNKTTPPPGAKYQSTWFYWLTAHAIANGGFVTLATGSYKLGLAEVLCHWLIDFGKCNNCYGIHRDQLMHIFCKLVWWFIAMAMV